MIGRGWSTSTVLSEYRDDPVRFCREVLGFEPWGKQRDIMRSVARNRRTAVRSGHGVGKTLLDAAIALWWVCTRAGSACALTAPTGRQVQRGAWRELILLGNSMRARGINLIPDVPLKPESGMNWPDGRSIFGFAGDDPANVSGPAAKTMLVIADEAAGISDAVWTAIQSLRKGGGPALVTGNPTTTSGWFFDAFENELDEDNPTGWATFEVSCFDCPNVVEQRTIIEGLVDQSYIDEIASDYGTDSPTYSVRVLGKPPAATPNAVIGYAALEAALARFADEDFLAGPDGLELGCDVARYGDDFSTVGAKRGSALAPPDWLHKQYDLEAAVNGYDAAPVAGMVVALMRAIRRPLERVRIKVDVGGGYGEGVVQVLRALRDHPDPTQRLDDRVTIVSVNSSEKALNPAKFARRRDELWWAAREVLAHGSIAPDKQARKELLAPTYSLTPSGQIKVEGKDETKKKLKGRSPDRADAVCLAAFDAPASDMPKAQPKASGSRWSGSAGRGFG